MKHQYSFLRRFQSVIVLTLIIALVCNGRKSSIGVEKKDESKKSSEPISLQMAMILGAPGTTVELTLRNNTQREFVTNEFGVNFNKLSLVDPDGKPVEELDNVAAGIATPIFIKPSESARWQLDVEEIFEIYELKKPGVYRLSWKVAENWPGREFKWYRSSEMLLKVDPRFKLPNLYMYETDR